MALKEWIYTTNFLLIIQFSNIFFLFIYCNRTRVNCSKLYRNAIETLEIFNENSCVCGSNVHSCTKQNFSITLTNRKNLTIEKKKLHNYDIGYKTSITKNVIQQNLQHSLSLWGKTETLWSVYHRQFPYKLDI